MDSRRIDQIESAQKTRMQGFPQSVFMLPQLVKVMRKDSMSGIWQKITISGKKNLPIKPKKGSSGMPEGLKYGETPFFPFIKGQKNDQEIG
jgi:hypothetical protein